MKKGFTLIELLAVIAILAIISVIIVPRLTGFIDKTKEQSALESARGYIKTINMSLISNDSSMSDDIIKNGIYYTKDISVYVKGTIPENGIVTIDENEVSRARLCMNNYSIDYKNKKFEKSLNDYCGETRVTLYSNNTKLKTMSEVKDYLIDKTNKTNIYCNNGSIPKGDDKLTVEYPIGNTVCVLSSSLKNTQKNMKLNEYSILMLNDEAVDSIGLSIPKEKEVLFDLNGKKIKSVNSDNTNESNDSEYSTIHYIFHVNGSLVINDETNKGLVESDIGSEAIMINPGASVVINGGNYNGRRAINNNGNLVVNGGYYTSKLHDVIGNYKQSKITINDGTFECNVDSITLYLADDSSAYVYGGVFTNKENATLFTNTSGIVNIESKKPIYIGNYKYATEEENTWTPAAIKNLKSSRISIKGEVADACSEEKGINTKGICLFAKLRSVVNDNLTADSIIYIDGASIISESLRAVNTYSSTINLINTYVKGDSAISVDIGENLVDYKTGMINICNSTVFSDSHDIVIQSQGNVRYKSNVRLNNKTFYDTNSPTHIKLDNKIKCK